MIVSVPSGLRNGKLIRLAMRAGGGSVSGQLVAAMHTDHTGHHVGSGHVM